MTSDAGLRPAVAAEFVALADLLDSATDAPMGNLRAEVMQHWTPPGGGWHGALNHVVIHGLDVTVPLGVPRRSPDATIRVVLDDLTVAACRHTPAPASRGAACRPPTLTCRADRARSCAARPNTWHWCSAAGQSPRDGSKASCFS